MQNIDIKYVKRLNRTRAWSLVNDAVAASNEFSVFRSSNSGLSYDVEAIIASDENGNPIGFIAFKHEEWNASYDIHLAYVIEECRGKGYHSAMFNKLVELAKENDIDKITSSTSIDNIKAQRAFERQGRVAHGINYIYPVADWIFKGDK